MDRKFVYLVLKPFCLLIHKSNERVTLGNGNFDDFLLDVIWKNSVPLFPLLSRFQVDGISSFAVLQ